MTGLDQAARESLIAQLRAYLDQQEGEAGPCDDDGGVDLHTLLAEMAALKNEIRLESRQFKGMLDEMRGFGDALRERNERLEHELERSREQATSAARQAERAVLLDLLDLHDRLKAGVEASTGRKRPWLARLLPAQTRLTDSLAQGLALSLRRVEAVLAGHRAYPIEVLGKILDPHVMRAVGVVSEAGQPDALVLREARRGFLHDGELLRTADVIVNRTKLES